MKLARQRQLVAAAVLTVAALVALVAVKGQQLGPASSAVFQGLTVVVSIYGGLLFAREGNDESVRSAARKSVRRVLVNYESLGRLAAVIERVKEELLSYGDGNFVRTDLVEVSLSGLSDYVVEQLASADIAVQDWRDLAPDDVDAELARYKNGRGGVSA